MSISKSKKLEQKTTFNICNDNDPCIFVDEKMKVFFLDKENFEPVYVEKFDNFSLVVCWLDFWTDDFCVRITDYQDAEELEMENIILLPPDFSPS